MILKRVKRRKFTEWNNIIKNIEKVYIESGNLNHKRETNGNAEEAHDLP